MARQLLREDAVFPVRETDLELAIPPDPEAVYWLRPITTDVARSITRKHTQKVPNRRTHQREEETNRIAVNDDLLDHAIARWEGVFDNGQPAACDLVHKLLLPVDVQSALLERAQVGGGEKTASFREPADVLPVLGR